MHVIINIYISTRRAHHQAYAQTQTYAHTYTQMRSVRADDDVGNSTGQTPVKTIHTHTHMSMLFVRVCA